MKKCLLYIFLFLSGITSAQVTFTVRTTGTTQPLKGTTITANGIGYAVGSGGTILMSEDGGETWTSQTTPTTASFEDVMYGGSDIDGDEYVWACGSSATVVRTTDEGTTWELQASGAPVTAYTINFQGISNGLMMGDGFYASSINGGNVFSPVMTSFTYTAVDFIGATGWVCGNDGMIKKTTDGGATWTDQSSGTALGLAGIDFINANEGWACGYTGTILHTTDGGTTWEAQLSATANLISAIKFVDSENGWACGYTGTILRTTNGGETWVNYSLEGGTLVWLQSIALINANEGWIVGEGGLILSFVADPSDAGIQDLQAVQVSVYPNPTTSMLTIETKAEVQTIEIYTLSGRLIQRESTTSFSVASLVEGVYFVQIQTSEGSITKRFVKR